MLNVTEILLLLLELAVYFAAMLTLFRFRDRLGIGTFYCALGSLHFLETYLAACVYVQVFPGMTLSPGSVVLFTGKLLLLLLVYIREDAATVRQPIYGIFLGNLITALLVPVLRQHLILPNADGSPADIGLMSNLGGLMVWGTFLLFIDSIVIILLFERLGKLPWMRKHMVVRLWLVSAAVLTMDQFGFFSALHLLLNVPFTAGLGGWVGKLLVSGIYSGLLAAYLRWGEPAVISSTSPLRVGDVFEVLTYRERYEALRQEAWRDSLTGLQHRGQLEDQGQAMLERARFRNLPVSILMIDVDNFKTINDSNGHKAGDMVLRHIGQVLTETLRSSDFACRYGGDEFVVLTPGTPQNGALVLGELLRECISAADVQVLAFTHADAPTMPEVTVSIGVATFPEDGATLDDIMRVADKQVYRAKSAGRDRVMA